LLAAFAPGAALIASGGTVSGAGVSLTIAPFASSTVDTWPATGGVAQATSATGETVNSGGTIVVSSGGIVSGISEGSGGALIVSSGGVASGGLAQGGTVTIGVGGSGVANQAQNGGNILVSGGTEISATVWIANLGPTFDTVESGGVTTATHISQGGVEYVSAGGLSLSAVTDQLGSQVVLSGGSAVSATIEGLQVVSAGGFVSATKLMSGFAGYPAVLKDAGTVSGVTISGTGASAVVLSGGVESGAVVNSGGTDIVSSVGSTTGTVVNSGGTEELYIGAAFSNATYRAGANVALTGHISAPPPIQVRGFTWTVTRHNLPSGATPSDASAQCDWWGRAEVDVNSGGLISATRSAPAAQPPPRAPAG
jgi:autotransporter passenger strand-loop-strand repeat protein